MDRNTEIEQYFALWNESFPVAATHDHWVRWGKLLRVWLPSIDGVPMNVEVTGDFPRALKKWTSLVSRPFCFTIRFAPHGASELKYLALRFQYQTPWFAPHGASELKCGHS